MMVKIRRNFPTKKGPWEGSWYMRGIIYSRCDVAVSCLNEKFWNEKGHMEYNQPQKKATHQFTSRYLSTIHYTHTYTHPPQQLYTLDKTTFVFLHSHYTTLHYTLYLPHSLPLQSHQQLRNENNVEIRFIFFNKYDF